MIQELMNKVELIIEIGIGRNLWLYSKIKEWGFEGEYAGINFSDEMRTKPEGMSYYCLDALDSKKMNELIGKRRAIIISHAALLQILHQSAEKFEDRFEEAIKSFNYFNVNFFCHFRPTLSILNTNIPRYEEFKRKMTVKGWKNIEIRFNEIGIEGWPNSDLILIQKKLEANQYFSVGPFYSINSLTNFSAYL